MYTRPITDEDLAERAQLTRTIEQYRERGECPSCCDLRNGNVYPDRTDRTFSEDDSFVCMLEQYPRNIGHSIILPRQHWEDMSELPETMFPSVYGLIHRCVHALKQALGAEKVYLCTMCDGARNHLHYQLIPRLPGDSISGSKLFVAERKVLIRASELTEKVRAAMTGVDGLSQ